MNDITKVTLAMPIEAARKLMQDPEAAKEYLRQQGFDVVAIQWPEPGFTWESPTGETITWSIDLCRQLIGDRPPVEDAALDLYGVARCLKSNGRVAELDPEYALTTDLSKPLIAVISPLEVVEGHHVIILIDGWHRMLKAFLTQFDGKLQVHVLTAEEEKQCRVRRIG